MASDFVPLEKLLAVTTPGVITEQPRPDKVRLKDPWDPHFNPVKDAMPVVWWGAIWIRPGRYLTPDGFVVDANGGLMGDDECPGCGTEPDGADYSRWVRIASEYPNAKPWEFDWTYCPVCTPLEIRGSLEVRRRGTKPGAR